MRRANRGMMRSITASPLARLSLFRACRWHAGSQGVARNLRTLLTRSRVHRMPQACGAGRWATAHKQ